MLLRRTLFILLLTLPWQQPSPAAASVELSTDDQVIRLLNLTYAGGYNKGASPKPANGTAHTVIITINLVKLMNVDMVKQLVTLECTIAMIWTDPRLAWHTLASAELAGKNKSIYAPMDWVWTPDVYINQPAEIRSYDRSQLLANIRSDGQVTVNHPIGVTIKCNMHMESFPFDSQSCTFSMASAALKPKSTMELVVQQSPAILYSIKFLRSNEYCIIDIDSKLHNVHGEYQQATVIVIFKRLAIYYVTVLIIPSALILVTCIFGFLIPPDSGDRLALNVAILLSMSVFLQLAGSITPAQSESVPVLTWYFTVAMAVTALSTVGSIIVLMCYRRAASEQPVSNRALRLLFLNRLCGWAQGEPVVKPDDVSEFADPAPSSSSMAKNAPVDGAEWRQIGRSIDRLLAVGAVSASAGVLLFLFAAAYGNGPLSCP